ncbi:MAG: hypothetical protein LCH58_07045 [Bacteroidetes bacterium]|uniref:hypothetical protein n=1 Tax=Phnomibacter sp. TaxID=2836217 RepID=UPI002FDE76AE|nr:hypothetical protein [Bacteroidota bacterium]
MKRSATLQRLLISLSLICSCFAALSQTIDYKQVLDNWKKDYPQEKVFLQTDKAHYLPGEVIFMKAWCSVDGEPSFLSRIIYVDLVNEKGEVIAKNMYKLDSLSSTGADIELPKNIASGKYNINAYTLWMLNFPEFVASKPIYIYADDFLEKQQQSKAVAKIQLHFFPEGGQWVAGAAGRMAFKATNEKGLPVAVKAIVKNANGSRSYSLDAWHDGMGMFEYEAPQLGEKYVAEVMSTSGQLLQFPLPAVQPFGISMRLENDQPGKLFVLLEAPAMVTDSLKKIQVVAQIHGQVCFRAWLNVAEGEMAVPISKKYLPPGIVQVTLFDAINRPLAERLAFIGGVAYQQALVNTDSVHLKARAKSMVSFKMPLQEARSISVLVTDGDLHKDSRDETIVSSLILTSDIKGYVHNPGQYITDTAATAAAKIDLLMMTNGWRRFVWKELLTGQFPAIRYPVETGIALMGEMTKSDRKEAVTDGYVSFIIKNKDSASILAEAGVTDKGQFLLNNLDLNGKTQVAYMGTNRKKEGFIVDVKLKPRFIDTLKRSSRLPLVSFDTADLRNRSSAWANYLQAKVNLLDTPSFNGFNFLGNVVVKARKLSPTDSLNNEYTTGPFAMGQSVNPEDMKNYRTVWQVLQASLPGITVEGDFFNPTVFFNRFQGLNMFSSNNSNSANIIAGSNGEEVNMLLESNGIAYFLNEVNVSKDVINTLNPNEVALIKVLKNEGAMLGASAGVLAFYTKNNAVNATDAIYQKNYTRTTIQGYAAVREFYMPDYIAMPGLNSMSTDSRYTLYWSSKLQPGKDGTYRFQYFHNDISKKIKLIIQGITASGQLIYTEKIVE